MESNLPETGIYYLSSYGAIVRATLLIHIESNKMSTPPEKPL